MHALYRRFIKLREVEDTGTPLSPVAKMQASVSILLDSLPHRFLRIGYLFSHYCNYTMGTIV